MVRRLSMLKVCLKFEQKFLVGLVVCIFSEFYHFFE
jgi:hypothetical protein